MKNILLALVCIVTMSFKGIAGNDPKCCTDKCSKQCIEMCKKNNCTDKDCCKLGKDKCCATATACSKDKAACCSKEQASVSCNENNSAEKTDSKASSCCKKK